MLQTQNSRCRQNEKKKKKTVLAQRFSSRAPHPMRLGGEVGGWRRPAEKSEQFIHASHPDAHVPGAPTMERFCVVFSLLP